jgi:hypothetical protein
MLLHLTLPLLFNASNFIGGVVVNILVVISVSVNWSSFCTFSPLWIVLGTRLCDLSMLGKYLVTVLSPIYQDEKLHSPATNLGTICANPKI